MPEKNKKENEKNRKKNNNHVENLHVERTEYLHQDITKGTFTIISTISTGIY